MPLDSCALPPPPHPGLRRPVVTIYTLLIGLNLAAWAWALLAFRQHTLLLGTALLAYSFGLRHAVDPDHIAAIDNVTRKLMQAGERPVSVGFFFAVGHSLVVVLVVAALAGAAAALQTRLHDFQAIGGVIATCVSAGFLFVIAAINMVILASVYRTFRHVRRGGAYIEAELDLLLGGRGLLARLFRPLFRLVRRSWHMLPIGVLFGLGFETATEVSLLGMSSTEAAQGVSIWTVMVFPALFAAGMALVDTSDGVLMLGAYDWAFVKPMRKLYYNMIITFVSVVVAVCIGGIEALGLIVDRFSLSGPGWDAISAVNDHFDFLGYVIVGVFALTWLAAVAFYRARGYDRLDVLSRDP